MRFEQIAGLSINSTSNDGRRCFMYWINIVKADQCVKLEFSQLQLLSFNL